MSNSIPFPTWNPPRIHVKGLLLYVKLFSLGAEFHILGGIYSEIRPHFRAKKQQNKNKMRWQLSNRLSVIVMSLGF